MSFCPSDDIHSIYLDNELPVDYKNQYEANVKNCPECQKKLNMLKGVSSLLRQDATCICPDSHYVDESFDRLQIKMSYRKNSCENTRKHKYNFVYLVGAAAAVFAALIVPARLANVQKNQNNGIYYVHPAMTAVSGGSIAQVPVSSVVSSRLSGRSSFGNNVAFDSGKSVVFSGNIHDNVFSSDSQNKQNISHSFASDVINASVLKPELEENSISIRITIPGVGQIPVTTEITFPLDVMSGKF